MERPVVFVSAEDARAWAAAGLPSGSWKLSFEKLHGMESCLVQPRLQEKRG